MKNWFSFVLVLLLVGVPGDRAAAGGKEKKPAGAAELVGTLAWRKELIAEANQVMRRYLRAKGKKPAGNEIPPEFWGGAITRLNPLMVVNDHINVLIVTKEAEKMSEGYYVCLPISSHAPNVEGRFAEFNILSKPGDKTFGELYRFKMKSDNAALRGGR